jgi:hypothetical protein
MLVLHVISQYATELQERDLLSLKKIGLNDSYSLEWDNDPAMKIREWQM